MKTYPLQGVLGQPFGIRIAASAAEARILFLSGTYPGTAHARRIADAEQLTYSLGSKEDY